MATIRCPYCTRRFAVTSVAAPAPEQPAPRYRVVSNRTGQVLTPRPLRLAIAHAHADYLEDCGFDVRVERLGVQECAS